MKDTTNWNNFLSRNKIPKNPESKSYMVITSGFDLNRLGFLSNFLEILSEITTKNVEVVTTISPNPQKFKNRYNVKFTEIHTNQSNTKFNNMAICNFLRIIRYLKTQFNITFYLLRTKDYDTYIFFLAQSLTVPIIVLRLLGKKVILILGASDSKMGQSKNDCLLSILGFIDQVNFFFANSLIIYSQNLIKEWNLENYQKKIVIAHRHFLDLNLFTITSPPMSKRAPIIGYIGRFSPEKGIQHFTQALPAILSNNQDIRVFICGDGQLEKTIETYLQEEDLTDRVELLAWIPHDELPQYLNQLRLLVLPSHTEGLPNIMLEAMACGTPVLATPVGAIPDVIIDGKTGFIMSNNSPECIAKNVMRVLNSLDLEQIAENGRQFVQTNFTFDREVARWKEVLE
ncbi:glycosyltransferase family 4 protein [Methanogenium sp. S4BF]|uniref:glycosyltransferase family 4 protein n=1 Tax=Methanogenium sp. S4BF TaxID=1789226 RepID=UPI002416CDE6|nr:glycosyltransferase family 4 protein [Methanogenium sp. S4BF]WFN35012.1 glycosyltransferase family 4 protein [Methanogenium sp. S4BF]